MRTKLGCFELETIFDALTKACVVKALLSKPALAR
jgi:hypothetical protein